MRLTTVVVASDNVNRHGVHYVRSDGTFSISFLYVNHRILVYIFARPGLIGERENYN